MTPQECALVLAKCAAFDYRAVGGSDVAAWHEVIGKLDLADALEAVTIHYAETSQRAMPADILRHGRRVRDDRTRSPHEVRVLPSRFESDEDRAERVQRGLAQVRAVLQPLMDRLAAQRDDKGDDDPIRRRAIERARRERKGSRA